MEGKDEDLYHQIFLEDQTQANSLAFPDDWYSRLSSIKKRDRKRDIKKALEVIFEKE